VEIGGDGADAPLDAVRIGSEEVEIGEKIRGY
jgi:hypothetical protein